MSSPETDPHSNDLHELVNISLDVEALDGIAGPRRGKIPLRVKLRHWRMKLSQWDQRHWGAYFVLVVLSFTVAIGVTMLTSWLIKKRNGSE